MSRKTNDKDQLDGKAPHGIKPSDFMRNLRPECYSDSEDRTRIHLRADQFEYHLSTITARNQTHDFELFIRKLCERAICPDLRAQTGPEGGGDSKVDTETMPVSEEIRERHYEGIANQGNEKWAFAISANKRWTDKARSDVRSIVGMGRSYDQIFFITSQHARAKDRSRLEDELTKAHRIPVTVHDRTWIVDQTIDKERTDLAFTFLGVGEVARGDSKLGPEDYSRTKQLEEIERAIENPGKFVRMETQLVSEALAAAKLSRNLELKRELTDGRLTRAIRLANKYGTSRQKLEAHYEYIWTAFWWFDDFDLLLNEYERFEESVLKSDNAIDLEWLGNLHQLLVNSVIYGHVSEEDSKFWERANRLESKLAVLATERGRPNNSLEARSVILRIRLSRVMLNRDKEQLPEIWKEYSDVVKAACGLGEFNFDMLIRFIDTAGDIAGNDPEYNRLVTQCAAAVSKRKSEREAALMYLSRAKKLTSEDSYDMIRWLGRAAVDLSKQECMDEFFEATYYLAASYRNVGLMWAARASCIMAMATLLIEAENAGEMPVESVPTTFLWTWIALELRHIPDVLNNIQLLNGLLAKLPLIKESKEQINTNLRNFDYVLGYLILNLDPIDLERLEKLPDLLYGLGLHMSRTALLYSLGYSDTLRTENVIPENETEEEIAELMSQLKAKNYMNHAGVPLVVNEDSPHIMSSSILGMRVFINLDGSKMIPVAETILGTLEGFFATAIEQQIMPHTEEYRIVLTICKDVVKPKIKSDTLEMESHILWPDKLLIDEYEHQFDVRTVLTQLACEILIKGCSAQNNKGLIERMFRDDAVLHQITMIGSCSNSFSRINQQYFSQLSDWDKYEPRRFRIKEQGPTLITKKQDSGSTPRNLEELSDYSIPKNHKKLAVRSVVEPQKWDKAIWRGCGYIQNGSTNPPYLALLFEDADSGQSIFRRWRERFGNKDENDVIAISIIRNVPGWNPHHYIVQIGSNLKNSNNQDNFKLYMMMTRSLEMTPANSEHLERFLACYRRVGAYIVIPGFLPKGETANPKFCFDAAIEKHALTVKNAADIKETDPEAVALRIRNLKLT